MMKRFKDKTVIVTGAGSDIGQATAIRFAREGANVVLVGSTSETLEATSSQFPEDHTWIHADTHLTVTCDITQQHQVEAMIEHVIKKFDGIDVVVNNTGKDTKGKTTALTNEEWQSAIDVNQNGTLYVCQAAMPALTQSKGNIVNVSSLLGTASDWNKSTYDAVKTGVADLTHRLAIELGPKGVRVNAVNPAVIKTENAQQSIEQSEKWLAGCPLGRLATPDDVAAAITFLASEDAAMITGVNLPVDGGVNASTGSTE